MLMLQPRTMGFSVNDRICVGEHFGTVRYVGPLPQWSQTAYGIEWDDPNRGKNDGTVNGVRYFEAPLGSASFVKASNKSIVEPRSFIAAVLHRYAENNSSLRHELTIGSEVIDAVGFDKLNALQKDVSKLTTVMVDRQGISCAGNFEPLSAVEYVDLSYNLLTSWTEVGAILRGLPNVKSVNLNGNRLVGTPNIQLSPTVSHISLSDVRNEQLLSLDVGSVSSLELAGNSLRSESFEEWKAPEGLSRLDVSWNSIETFPDSWSSLTHVVLAHNSLSSLPDMEVFPNILSLDLRFNPIASFSEIDAISTKFPSLRELRISHCPVFDGLASDEMAFQLIGRLPCCSKNGEGISKLNGSEISPQEITNGELYFISQVRKKATTYSNETRWKQLLQKYSLEAESHEQARDSIKVTLSVRTAESPETELFAQRFLLRNSVLRLKGVISKRINVSVLDFSLFHYTNDFYNQAEVLDDDIATLQSLGLGPTHNMYIDVTHELSSRSHKPSPK